MAITLFEGKITIEDNGLTYLQDIAQESIDQGWSPAFKQLGNSTYMSPYEIIVRGTTDFRIGWIRPETLSFNYAEGDFENQSHYPLDVRCEDFIMGRNSENYGDNYGALIQMNDTYRKGMILYPTETLEVHNSTFQDLHYCNIKLDGTNYGNVKNIIFAECHFGVNIQNSVNTKNISIVGGYYGLSGTPNTVDGLIIENSNVGIIMEGEGGTFSNVEIVNVLSDRETFLRCGNSGYDDKILNYIDCKVTKEKMSFYISGNGTCRNYQNLQSTFKFKLNDNGVNLGGVNVDVYDKDNNLIFNDVTDVNGEINDVITYFTKYKDVDYGEAVGNEVSIDYEPFKIIMTKAGYETYEIKNLHVTEGEPTTIRGSMVQSKEISYIF